MHRATFEKFFEMDDVGGGLRAALLRTMVLQSAPPADLMVRVAPQHSRVAAKGARLRVGLPTSTYLARPPGRGRVPS
jgi:hypothetical protein